MATAPPSGAQGPMEEVGSLLKLAQSYKPQQGAGSKGRGRVCCNLKKITNRKKTEGPADGDTRGFPLISWPGEFLVPLNELSTKCWTLPRVPATACDPSPFSPRLTTHPFLITP